MLQFMQLELPMIDDHGWKIIFMIACSRQSNYAGYVQYILDYGGF